MVADFFQETLRFTVEPVTTQVLSNRDVFVETNNSSTPLVDRHAVDSKGSPSDTFYAVNLAEQQYHMTLADLFDICSDMKRTSVVGLIMCCIAHHPRFKDKTVSDVFEETASFVKEWDWHIRNTLGVPTCLSEVADSPNSAMAYLHLSAQMLNRLN
jgi:hypothetical protein